jgi:hypothetical protein
MSVGTVALSPFASHEAMGPSALIVGSTGAVGRQLLNSLLSESTFSRTYEIGRRKTEYPVHGIKTPPVEGLNKLSSVVVPNETFEDASALKAKLPEAKDWPCVYITLGTTRANAGSPEAFEKIDRECKVTLYSPASAFCLPEGLQGLILIVSRAFKLGRCHQCSKGRQAPNRPEPGVLLGTLHMYTTLREPRS